MFHDRRWSVRTRAPHADQLDSTESIISLVVGAILITAGTRGGRTASTIMVAIGAAFMLSGPGNVLVLNTDLNFLAFGLPNVIFSRVAAGLLLILGAWGRFTGRLPSNNPYQQERHPDDGTADVMPTIYPDGRRAGAPG
jgi:hypothetical protein